MRRRRAKRSKGFKLGGKGGLALGGGTIALLGLGAYFLLKGGGAGAGTSEAVIGGQKVQIKLSPKLKPAAVKSGETVTAKSLRLIQSRRPGMNYVPTQGQPGSGGEVALQVPSNGTFTRNLVLENGVYFAEIA